jgi:hypothetical protein
MSWAYALHIAYNFEHNIAFLIEIIDQYTLFLSLSFSLYGQSPLHFSRA